MNREHTLDKMLQVLKKHFEKCGYEVARYSNDFLPVRVPLYCKKDENGKLDELVVDFTTSSTISKDAFFPTMTIGGVRIFEASPLGFYQYYFIQAKTYLAYPDYVVETDEFNEFKKVCVKRGIGLLKTSKTKITEVVQSRPLFDEICNQLSMKNDDIKSKLEYYLRNCLHYFVYYPEPIYKIRAITGRVKGDISFVLIDKLSELENIAYNEELNKLAFNYRQERRDDYQIALDTIKKLWSGKGVQDIDYKGIGVEYPIIQRQLEDILLRNPEYRDHFLHQFQVFLLGAYVIDKLYGNEKCIKEFECRFKCPIEKAWLLASTYHDFNYSIQEYDFWIKEFFSQALSISQNTRCSLSPLNLDVVYIRENFLLKTQEICKVLNLEMNDVVMNFFYEEATTRRNHGLLSALSLLKLFENTAQTKMNHSGLIQAAVAIALHDENIWKAFSGREENDDSEWNLNFAKKKFLKNLEFKDQPLTFLLIFCDTVQEWGRVGKNYEESKPRLEDVTPGTNEILLTLSVEDDNSYERKMNEIHRVAKFLKDKRFVIELKSRASGKNTKIPMSGA